MTKPVLVLGTGVTALGVQRSLARRDIEYFTMGHEDRMLSRSRFTRRPPASWGTPRESELTSWLESLDLESGVLFPCSDSWAMSVASRGEAVRERFPASVPSPASLTRLVDKAAFRATLAELGIPHPVTADADAPDPLPNVPEEDLDHFFLKPTDSQRFIARYGVKGVHVESLEDARNKLSDMPPSEGSMLLQEYVPGPAENHYFIDGFIDRSGVVRSLLARQRLRMEPPDFGNSTFMRTVPLADVTPAAEALSRLLPEVGHRGVFSAEFKKDARDGVFKLLEVNARAWWYVEFACTSGVDVCQQAWLDALGRDVPDMFDYPVGRRLIYPYYDYQAYQRITGRHGPLGMLPWLGSVLGASQPVFNWSDPVPGGSALFGIVRRMIARAVRPRRR
jgi:predicted ATP-grasp superfamily ATP-dependent carboligase